MYENNLYFCIFVFPSRKNTQFLEFLVHAFFYKNIQDELAQKVKSFLRILTS